MTTDLIKRLTEAGEGARELDHRIACRLTCGVNGPFGAYSNAESWIKAAICERWGSPHYTTNLQDAVSAVPDGAEWLVEKRGASAHASIDWPRYEPASSHGHADTPALALCIAILKALEAKDE